MNILQITPYLYNYGFLLFEKTALTLARRFTDISGVIKEVFKALITGKNSGEYELAWIMTTYLILITTR
jgi:hypothetical protein